MKYMAEEADIRQLTNVLESGVWGTVGPWFFAAGDAVAKVFNSKHGLVTFSVTAALETMLRGWNIGYGDEVIVAAWSDPVDAMVTAAVGAAPVFADVCEQTLTLTCETIAAHVGKKTRAVIADLPAGNPCDARALSAFCKDKGLYLILNLGDAWATTLGGEPIVRYADAAFLDLGQGKTVDVGLAGALVTDNEEHYRLFYAYHNCGRPIGEDNTLHFDAIIGGDLRIAEWQACLIPERLAALPELIERSRAHRAAVKQAVGDTFDVVEGMEGGESSCCGTLLRAAADMTPETAAKALHDKGLYATAYYEAMHGQDFWKDPYFEKLTGTTIHAEDAAYPCSVQARHTVWYISNDIS